MNLFASKKSRLEQESPLLSQTEFASQAPLFENRSAKLFDFKNLRNNKFARPFYVIAAVLFLILALSILLQLTQRQTIMENASTQVVSPTINVDPLTERVQTLKTELKAADPTRQSLPFPQIDMTFSMAE